MYKHDYASEQPTKIYIRKQTVIMKTTISNLHTSFNILEIKNLEFHILHVKMLGINYCGESIQTIFKLRE